MKHFDTSEVREIRLADANYPRTENMPGVYPVHRESTEESYSTK